MYKINGGKIHSIIVQYLDREMMYKIGQSFGRNGIVCDIVRDENNFHFFGEVRYCVYTEDEDGMQSLWKTFEKYPVTVTYDK